jgi:hypothetical protein
LAQSLPRLFGTSQQLIIWTKFSQNPSTFRYRREPYFEQNQHSYWKSTWFPNLSIKPGSHHPHYLSLQNSVGPSLPR